MKKKRVKINRVKKIHKIAKTTVLKKPKLKIGKKTKVKRVSTGVKGFDKLIEGGFEEGSII